MTRRELIRWMLSVTAALPVGRIALRAQSNAFSAADLTTLEALADSVLPGELGRAGSKAITQAFIKWLAEYRSGADMGHGYGVLRARVTPTISVETYRTQLGALDQRARRGGGSFQSLSVPARQALVQQALDEASVRDLPQIPDGQHIVSDVMAFYFRSTQANDLCYRASIGREVCRGLSGSSRKPETLTSA
jgi:hypothetical protein